MVRVRTLGLPVLPPLPLCEPLFHSLEIGLTKERRLSNVVLLLLLLLSIALLSLSLVLEVVIVVVVAAAAAVASVSLSALPSLVSTVLLLLPIREPLARGLQLGVPMVLLGVIIILLIMITIIIITIIIVILIMTQIKRMHIITDIPICIMNQ